MTANPSKRNWAALNGLGHRCLLSVTDIRLPMKSSRNERPGEKQATPDELLDDLLDFIQRKFYQNHALAFTKDRPRLLEVGCAMAGDLAQQTRRNPFLRPATAKFSCPFSWTASASEPPTQSPTSRPTWPR